VGTKTEAKNSDDEAIRDFISGEVKKEPAKAKAVKS
jgi:hypothetical protein